MSTTYDANDLAHVYGMIENIDDNVEYRLLAKSTNSRLADDTIVMLSSDNGCQKHNGYNAGFQGWKGTPFEGGIHQFCFLRWLENFRLAKRWTASPRHIDITPTVLELCGCPSRRR